MTRNEIISEITAYVHKNELNETRLYSKEGVDILLSYFEEKINQLEKEKKTVTFKSLTEYNDKE